MKIFTIGLLCASLALSGCGSDVDKCVDAQVIAWKSGSRWQDSKTEADVRSKAYIVCLNAQGKN